MFMVVLLLVANGFLVGAAVGRLKASLAFGAGFLSYFYTLLTLASAAAWGERLDPADSLTFFIWAFAIPFLAAGALGSTALASDLSVGFWRTLKLSCACLALAGAAGALAAAQLMAAWGTDAFSVAMGIAYFGPQIVYVFLFKFALDYTQRRTEATESGSMELPILEDEPELLEASLPRPSAADRFVQQQSGWNKYLRPFLSENWMGLIGAVSLLAAWLLLSMWLWDQGRLSGYLIGLPPLALFTLATAWMSRRLQGKGSQAAPQVVALLSLLCLLSVPFYFVLAGGLLWQGQTIAGAGLAALSALGIPWAARRIQAPLGHDPTAFLLASNLLLFGSLLPQLQTGLWIVLPAGMLVLCWGLARAWKSAPQQSSFARTAYACHYLLTGVTACLFLESFPDKTLFALLLQPAAWAVGRFWPGPPARLAGMGLSLLGILVGLNSPFLPLVALLALGFWFVQWRSFDEHLALEVTAIHLIFLSWAIGNSEIIGLPSPYLLWAAFPALTAAAALEVYAGRAIRILTAAWPLFMGLTAAQAALDPISASAASQAVAPVLVLAAGSVLGYRALIRGSQPLWIFSLFWTPGCLYFCLPQPPLALFLALVAVAWLALSTFLSHALARRTSTEMLWCYSLTAALAQTADLTTGILGTGQSLGLGQYAGTLAALAALCGAARRSSSALPVYFCFPLAGLLAFRVLVEELKIHLESGLGAALAALALLLAAPLVQRLLARSEPEGDDGKPGGRAFPLVSRHFVQEPFENLSILLGSFGLLRALLAMGPLNDPGHYKLALAFPLQMAFWFLLALRRRRDEWAWPSMAALLGFLTGLILCFEWQLRPPAAALALALLLLAAERLKSSAHSIARILGVPLQHTSRTLLYLGVPLSLAADFYLMTMATPLHAALQALISALVFGRFLVPRFPVWVHLALFHGAVFSCSAVWGWRTQTGVIHASVVLDLLGGTTLLLLAVAWLLRGPLKAWQAGCARAVQAWLAGWSLLLALTLLSSSGRAWGAEVPWDSFWAAAVVAAAACAHFRFGVAGRVERISAGLADLSAAIGVMIFWPLSIRLLPFPHALPYLALAPALYHLALLERGVRRQASGVALQEGGLSPFWRYPWAAGLLAAAAVVSLAYPFFESLIFAGTSLAAAPLFRNAPAFLLLGLAALRLHRHESWSGFSLSGTVFTVAAAVLPAAQALSPWLPRPAEAALTVLAGHALLALLFVPNPLRTALFRFAGLGNGRQKDFCQMVFVLANTASQCSIIWLLELLQPGDLRVLPLLGLSLAGLLYHWRPVTVAAALLEAGLFLCLGMPVFYPAIPWQLPAVGLSSLLALCVLLRRRPAQKSWIHDAVFLLLVGFQAFNVIQRGGMLGLDSFTFLLFGFFCWALLPDRPFSAPPRYAHYFWVLWSGYFLLCLAGGLTDWTFPAWAVLCIWPPILTLWALGGRTVLRPWAQWAEKAIFELSLVAAVIGWLGLALDWRGVLFSWPLVAALELALFTAVAVTVRRAVLQVRRLEPVHPDHSSPLLLAALAEVMLFSALGLLRWKAHVSELLDLGSPWDGYLLLGLAGVAAGIREVMRRETPAFDGFLSRATQLYAWIGWGWMLYLDLAGGGHLHGFTGAILLSGLYAWLTRRGRRSNMAPAFAFGNVALFLAYADFDVHHPLFYIIPTVCSVLVLAHLLGDKLSERQMKSLRLACSLVLLGSSAFYNLAFFEDYPLGYSLVAALAALLGVLAGISLRIRIYLYMGTFFFIFNTLAILIQIVLQQPPDDVKLLVGLLFLVTGLFFTGAFVAFQTRRQAILQRYQTLRGELSEWE